MEVVKFNSAVDSRKIARTNFLEGVVTNAVGYTTTDNLKGIEFTVTGCPYNLRVITKNNPSMFLQSKCKFTGVMREYNGAQYFSPKDVAIIEQSALGKIAQAGVAYAGVI